VRHNSTAIRVLKRNFSSSSRCLASLCSCRRSNSGRPSTSVGCPAVADPRPSHEHQSLPIRTATTTDTTTSTHDQTTRTSRTEERADCRTECLSLLLLELFPLALPPRRILQGQVLLDTAALELHDHALGEHTLARARTESRTSRRQDTRSERVPFPSWWRRPWRRDSSAQRRRRRRRHLPAAAPALV
jgi:hypothetical protein